MKEIPAITHRAPHHTGPLKLLSLILKQSVKEVSCPHFTDENTEFQRNQLAQGHLTGE